MQSVETEKRGTATAVRAMRPGNDVVLQRCVNVRLALRIYLFFLPPLSLSLSNCRKANLILHRAEKISHYCRSLLHSTHIQSRTDTMAYVYCRSDEGRPPSNRQGSLHQSRTTCMEKLISVQRNTYSNTKLR